VAASLVRLVQDSQKTFNRLKHLGTSKVVGETPQRGNLRGFDISNNKCRLIAYINIIGATSLYPAFLIHTEYGKGRGKMTVNVIEKDTLDGLQRRRINFGCAERTYIAALWSLRRKNSERERKSSRVVTY